MKGFQATDEVKALSWRAFWRWLHEINPPLIPPLKKGVRVLSVGLVNPTYISMNFLSYSAALVLVFETIAGAERKRVEKINTNARIAAKFSSCKRQLLTLQNYISNVKPFHRSPIQLFNFVERFTPHPSRFTRRKAAFTLAEVLITLGIIGIVAAMTLPALIQKNNNRVVETRLQKFYSAFNQAILMAEKDYGDKTYWYEDLKGAEKDEEGNIIEGSSEAEKWFNKYLKPYLKVTRTETFSDGSLMVYFADGSALRPAAGYTRDWYFYPGDPKKCIAKYGEHFSKSAGICLFVFNFYPTSSAEGWRYHYRKGMEPYKASWNGDIKKLYEGSTFSCKTGNRHYCTAIIQDNGWKIPDDYPYKVSY